MPTIEDAILFATACHRGQTDKAGLPYITHPLRVMSMFVAPDEDAERIVAVLHDVVEDCGVTLEALIRRDYSRMVVDAIDAISRRKDEDYYEYIGRVSLNRLATRVKLADLRDNMDERRDSTKMLALVTLAKYRSARAYLSRPGIERAASDARPASAVPNT